MLRKEILATWRHRYGLRWRGTVLQWECFPTDWPQSQILRWVSKIQTYLTPSQHQYDTNVDTVLKSNGQFGMLSIDSCRDLVLFGRTRRPTSIRPFTFFNPSPLVFYRHSLHVKIGLMQVLAGCQCAESRKEEVREKREGWGEWEEDI